MSYRFMRIMVLFDLPVKTSRDRRNYTQFRKFLIKNGFIMMQKSVYSKLVLNATAADMMMRNVRKNKPDNGVVQMLKITEKQYASIEFVIGDNQSEYLASDSRMVII